MHILWWVSMVITYYRELVLTYRNNMTWLCGIRSSWARKTLYLTVLLRISTFSSMMTGACCRSWCDGWILVERKQQFPSDTSFSLLWVSSEISCSPMSRKCLSLIEKVNNCILLVILFVIIRVMAARTILQIMGASHNPLFAQFLVSDWFILSVDTTIVIRCSIAIRDTFWIVRWGWLPHPTQMWCIVTITPWQFPEHWRKYQFGILSWVQRCGHAVFVMPRYAA